MSLEDDDVEQLWLREQIEDEEILELFSDDPEGLKAAVRNLVHRARDDAAMESRLIDTLETAVEEGNDDSQASVWIAVVLGEARSQRALGLLIRCLGNDDDEVLQDAAGVALLRVGTPAVRLVMEAVEEEMGRQFNRMAYRFLGDTGVVEDEALHRWLREFLEERLEEERRTPPDESALEELAAAGGRLGHRNLLGSLKEVLARRYRGCNAVLEDAISMLEENEAEVPFVPTIPPWEERYGWLFEGDVGPSRLERLRGAAGPAEASGSVAETLFDVPEED